MTGTTYDDVEYVLAEIITEATGEPGVGRFERTLAKAALARLRELGLALSTPPADDVREALDHLDALNESGRIQYADYVALHDMVSRIEVRPHGTVTEAEDVSALRGEPIALSLFRMFVREHDEGDGPERVLVEVADIRTALRLLDARSHGTVTDAEAKELTTIHAIAQATGMSVESAFDALAAIRKAAREVHP